MSEVNDWNWEFWHNKFTAQTHGEYIFCAKFSLFLFRLFFRNISRISVKFTFELSSLPIFCITLNWINFYKQSIDVSILGTM